MGHLNEFTACGNSPLPTKHFCEVHMNDQSGDTADRLDLGMMTRAKRKEMGLDRRMSKKGGYQCQVSPKQDCWNAVYLQTMWHFAGSL